MIRTVAQLIDALGGSDAAAATLKAGKKALSNWKVANDLPLHVRIEASRIAIANGLILDPALVGPKPRRPYGSGVTKPTKKPYAKSKPRRHVAHAAE